MPKIFNVARHSVLSLEAPYPKTSSVQRSSRVHGATVEAEAMKDLWNSTLGTYFGYGLPIILIWQCIFPSCCEPVFRPTLNIGNAVSTDFKCRSSICPRKTGDRMWNHLMSAEPHLDWHLSLRTSIWQILPEFWFLTEIYKLRKNRASSFTILSMWWEDVARA